MSEDEIRQVVRAIKSSMSEEFEALNRRIDEMESGMMNELRSLGRRVTRLES